MTLPPPDQLITYDDFSTSWPMGAEKTELIDGVIIWYGDFDENDRLTVERAFPGRSAALVGGNLELRPRIG